LALVVARPPLASGSAASAPGYDGSAALWQLLAEGFHDADNYNHKLTRLFHIAAPAANLQQNLPVWLQSVGKNIVKPHGLSVVLTAASSLSLNMPGERGDFRIIIGRSDGRS
jgi:hypothetical protein